MINLNNRCNFKILVSMKKVTTFKGMDSSFGDIDLILT